MVKERKKTREELQAERDAAYAAVIQAGIDYRRSPETETDYDPLSDQPYGPFYAAYDNAVEVYNKTVEALKEFDKEMESVTAYVYGDGSELR